MNLKRADVPRVPHVPSQVEAAIAYVGSLPLAFKDWSIGTKGMRDMVGMLRLSNPEAFEARVMTILEIGTCRSLTSCLMAQVGVVYTLDVAHYPETKAILENAPAGTRSRIVHVNSGDAERGRALLARMRFDAVFIDGCHRYEAVVKDIEFAAPLSDALIFHDYDDRHSENVVLAVDAFAASCPLAFVSKTSSLAFCRVR